MSGPYRKGEILREKVFTIILELQKSTPIYYTLYDLDKMDSQELVYLVNGV